MDSPSNTSSTRKPEKNLGTGLGIGGLVCSIIIAIGIIPPIFGIAGIILGVLAIRKGQKKMGWTAIFLSAAIMVLAWSYFFYRAYHS